MDQCSAWSDCSDTLSGDTVNDEALTIKPYVLHNFKS